VRSGAGMAGMGLKAGISVAKVASSNTTKLTKMCGHAAVESTED
jgi:hypothetical protein